MSAILTVSELTSGVKELVESEFPFVWVRGQVQGVSRPPSGHIYFSLTDGNASLSTVWFKGNQWHGSSAGEQVHPVTGEIIDEEDSSRDLHERLEDGLEILCAGHLNVYPPRGVYQLVAELVQEQGVGSLQVAFEEMKKELDDLGYFSSEHKKPVPVNSQKVAVISALQGAALRDFLRLSGERGLGAEIRIYPSLVQGNGAPKQIAKAIHNVNKDKWADVVALIRGGGSPEDLWAFNTRPVADAIFQSKIPVVSGIGHEPDVSISDLVADARAATPSHAAQLLFGERGTLIQRVDDLWDDLLYAYEAFLQGKEGSYRNLRQGLLWLSPEKRLDRNIDRLSALQNRLEQGTRQLLTRAHGQQIYCGSRLQRAFEVSDIDRKGRRVRQLAGRMARAVGVLEERAKMRLEKADASLQALDPERPLRKGFSLVELAGGEFLRSVNDVQQGETVHIRLLDGRVAAQIIGNKKSPNNGTKSGMKDE
ncbi:MAG: exodeoxyribonuclease VII large subunit [Desulfovibrio sp.]